MIAVDPKTFEQGGKDGNVTGVIYLVLKDGAFPAKGWSDFPVIILGWWIEALLQIDASTRRNVEWSFMDGPQSIFLSKVTGGQSSSALEYSNVLDSLLEAATRVIAHCELHKMFSRDLDALRNAAQRLQAKQTFQRTNASRLPQIEIRTSSAAEARR